MGALSELLGAGVTAAGGAAIANNLVETGADAQDQLGGYDSTSGEFTGLAGGLVDATGFKPYSVTTGLGTGSVGADGSVTLGVGPDGTLQSTGTGGYTDGMGNINAGAGMISGAQDGLNTGAGMHQSAYTLGMNNAANPAYNQAMGAMQNGQQGIQSGMGTLQGALGGVQNAGAGLAGMQGQYQDASGNAMAGSMMGLQGMQGGYQNASQQAMANSMQDPAQREQDIFGRMMAAQQPGLDRQNAQMQARSFAQGRGGVAGSQYGGSGEQYAQSRAQMDAQNQAMLGAMSQSQNEMMNQGSLASQYGQLGNQVAGLQTQQASQYGNLGNQTAGMQGNLGQIAGQMGSQIGQLGAMGGSLGAQMGQLGQGQAALGQGAAALGSSIGSAMDANAMQAGQLGGMLANAGAQQAGLGLQGYTTGFQPMQTQMDAMGLGMQNANLAQTGQIAGANLAGQTALGGIQTDVNAQKAASEVYGNMFGSLGNIISSSDTIDDWLSKIPGLGG